VQPLWRTVHGLGVALQILLWCSLGAWLLKLLATANQRSIGEDAFAGDLGALRDIEDADSLVAGTGALAVMLMIAVFVLIVIWLWRAAKNLEVLGRVNPTLGPGWAIGGWFIPAANFVLPALVINDAWRGSDPQVPIGRTDWKRAPGSGLFVLWWIAFVAAGVLGIVSGGFSNESGEYESFADFRNGTSFGIAQAALYSVAAVLGALFVRALTRRQDTWGHHLGGRSTGFAAAPPMPPPMPPPTPGGPVSPSPGPT
jgi:hypothetical protein